MGKAITDTNCTSSERPNLATTRSPVGHWLMIHDAWAEDPGDWAVPDQVIKVVMWPTTVWRCPWPHRQWCSSQAHEVFWGLSTSYTFTRVIQLTLINHQPVVSKPLVAKQITKEKKWKKIHEALYKVEPVEYPIKCVSGQSLSHKKKVGTKQMVSCPTEKCCILLIDPTKNITKDSERTSNNETKHTT